MSHAFENLTFRPIVRDDLPLLHEWIQRPHVAQWWYAPCTLANVQADYLPTIDGLSSTKAYIACLNDRSIGFIQAYVVKDSADGWGKAETDPGVRGIDQFLADASRLNQGLGTSMIRSFVAMLFSDSHVTSVQTDPDPANHRAIRCYTKAGFKPVDNIITPDGLALLMRCDRPDQADRLTPSPAVASKPSA